MSDLAGLIYLAPGLLGPIAPTLADAARSQAKVPTLARLLARAKRRPLTGTSAEALIAHLYPQAPAPGALAAAGMGLTDTVQYYRVAPVHLRADRDRLLLFAGDDVALTATEAQAVTSAFNAVFSADGMQLDLTGPAGVMSATAPLGPNLPALFDVAGRYLDTVLPGEAAARPWRQLLNEVQMLLHDHPVNQARAERGALTVNGLWFWGGGPAIANPSSPPADVEHALVRGLMAMDQTPGETNHPANLTVWEAAANALMAGDIPAWLAALTSFEQTLAPVIDNTARQGAKGVTLLPGNGWAYTLGHHSHWRFWRRADIARHWAIQ